MKKQKHSTKDIVRKCVVWTLVILSLPLILLGEPVIKVFGLLVAGLAVWGDISSSKKDNPSGQLHYTEEPRKPNTAKSQILIASEDTTKKFNETIVLPKKPIVIVLVIALVVGAYSIGYATGKNTAVRLSNQPTVTAP